MPRFAREGDNDDDDEFSSENAKELLDGWTNTYGSTQRSSSFDNTPVTPPQGPKDSWRFDLGLLEKSRRAEPTRGVNRAKSAFETRTAIETIAGPSDDDSDESDGLSFLSQMEEANMAMEAITRRTFEPPVRNVPRGEKSLPKSGRSMPKKSYSSDGTSLNDFIGKESGHGLGSDHSAHSNCSYDIDYSDTELNKNASTATSELLEQRRAARLERMEKVRLRIAREKEEARIRKEEDERRAKDLDMSEDARRKRAYEWYRRLGMMTRKEMKKRVRCMGQESKVTEADCDLLPWNFQGTLVNTAKLQKLGVN